MDLSFYDFSERLKAVDREGRLESICKRSGIPLTTKFTPMQLFPPNTGQEALRKFFRELGYEVPSDEEIVLTIGGDVAEEC